MNWPGGGTGDDYGYDDWAIRTKRERCGDPLNWGYRCVCRIPQVGVSCLTMSSREHACCTGCHSGSSLWHVSSLCLFAGQSNSNLVSDRPRARRRARQARAVTSRYQTTFTWCNRREATRIIIYFSRNNGKAHQERGHQASVSAI